MLGEGEVGGQATGLPLPAALLLKDGISKAAEASEEVEKKWRPVGRQARGDTGRRHRGQGR